jgi:pimeloyl-ACP methyl ester carboxylesterase
MPSLETPAFWSHQKSFGDSFNATDIFSSIESKAVACYKAEEMKLHFKQSGRGRAVILLHGLFGSADNWHHAALRLAEKFHVLAVDQRNHGQSPHSGEMNYPLMARDLDGFMAAHGIASARVIGHSMGGKTAMQFALQFPHRVEKLIVADMAPRQYLPAHEKIFAAQLALDLKSFSTRQQIEDALAPEIPNVVLRRFLLKNLRRDAAGNFFWKINLRGLAENYLRLGEAVVASAPFAKPTQFIRGGKSNYIKPEDESLIRELFPQATIQTIAAAGHWVHADQPEDFLRLVFDFLE